MSNTPLTIAQLQAIDLAKEELVLAAERLLNEAGMPKMSTKVFGDSQLRNLIAVAAETESPAVVSNFIRYQMGRDGARKHWRKTRPETSIEGREMSLGDRFIYDIEEDGGAIDRAIKTDGLSHLKGREQQMARMMLIRYFLGFASRYRKFLGTKRDH